MRVLAFLLLSCAATCAFAAPSLEDVEHAVHRGDYAAAESMTREVVTERPNSAKAHYVLAEILAHEGKLADARTEAAAARRIDPDIRFTSPEKFRQFEAQLGGGNGAAATRAAPAKVAKESGGSSSMLWVLLLVGAAVVFFAMRRRSPPMQPPNYANGPAGMPGGPGYPPTGYPGYKGPMNPGSGLGGKVAAGLGGLAAGMVAEHLLEEAMGRHHGTTIDPNLSGDQPASLEDRPIDFGSGNDWGGDSGGGGGDSGGFDSGGSSDW